jgi:hypothetical protein
MKHLGIYFLIAITVCFTTAYGQDDWLLQVVGFTFTPGQAQAVANYGHYGLIADTESGLSVFNVEDPLTPLYVGSFNHGGIVNDLVVNGHYAYLAHWARGVKIIDLTNPAEPESVGAFNTPGTTTDVFLQGNLLYAADLFNGLVILNVANGTSLAQAGHIPSQEGIAAVAGLDSVIYVAWQGIGLKTYTLGDTLNPVYKYTTHLNCDCNDIVIYQHYLLLACGQSGMLIYDIANPLQPDSITQVNTPGSTNRIAVKDTIAYLADGANGIVAVDIFDPRAPSIIQTMDTPVYAGGVAFFNDFVLVADRLSILVVYHESLVGIDDDRRPELPDNYRIANCYPNPFNAVTKIDFELKSGGSVNLSVYDIRGSLVSNLADGYYSAGNYSVEWHADDISSGIYFVRLAGDSESLSKPVTARVVYLK